MVLAAMRSVVRRARKDALLTRRTYSERLATKMKG
jgi:hypothetical protein